MFFFFDKRNLLGIHRCFFVPSMNMTILFGNICFSRHLQFSERTADPDAGEGVEQPHRSKKVKVTEPEALEFSPSFCCEKKIK